MNYRVSSRDQAITRRVLEGESCHHVAQDYGVSGSRIRQITFATVHRVLPYAPVLRGKSLFWLRHYRGLVLTSLTLAQQEETP